MVTWLTWNFSRSFRHSNTVLTLKSPSLDAVTLMASLAVRSETHEICLRTALKGRLRALPVTKRLFKDPMVFLSRCVRFTALGKNEPLYSRERRGRGEPSRLVPKIVPARGSSYASAERGAQRERWGTWRGSTILRERAWRLRRRWAFFVRPVLIDLF